MKKHIKVLTEVLVIIALGSLVVIAFGNQPTYGDQKTMYELGLFLLCFMVGFIVIIRVVNGYIDWALGEKAFWLFAPNTEKERSEALRILFILGRVGAF